MKTTATLSTCLATLVLALLFAGCLDTDVKTTVAPNGSSDRTVKISSGKSDLSGFAFPRPDDPSWTISREESTKDGKKEYVLIGKKHFSDPEALAREYASRPDTTALRLSVNLKKSFAWFYTYFEYTETYHFNNPYGLVPIGNFMSPQEIDRFMHSGDEGDLKSKYETWEFREKYEAGFAALLDTVARRSDGAELTALLKAHKEGIFERALHEDDKDSTKENKKSKSGQTEKDSMSADAEFSKIVMRLLAEETGSPVAGTLKGEFERALSVTSEQERKWGSLGDGYTNGVEMPGLLLESNSDDVKGASASWKFTSQQIRVHDVVMHASSRVANLWAFIVTGCGVILLVGLSALSFFSARRSRRSSGPNLSR